MRLKLVADVGPADSSEGDWACFAEPLVTSGVPTQAVTVFDSAKKAGVRANALKKLPEPEASLNARWRFDEKKGPRANDDSGNENHGVVNAAARVEGSRGGALRFDGTSSFIAVNGSAELTPAAFTLVARVNPASFQASDMGPIVLSKYGGNYKGYVLYLERGGRPGLRLSTASGKKLATLQAPDAITLNGWHQLAATYDGATASLYVDGVLKKSAAAELMHDEAVPLTIGKGSWFNGGYFTGLIDEVAVYGRALTAGEIAGLYAGH